MSVKAGMRAFWRSQPFFRQQPTLRFTQQRYASTAEAATEAGAKAGKTGLAAFWASPTGPKTVHFWAPIMKWGVVLSGAADFARPASQLSISQNAALAATGAIWTRWCFIIKPRNVFLASVNFLLFCVGATQVGRALVYQQSVKGDSVAQEAEKAAKQGGNMLEKIAEDPKGAVKNIVSPK